MITIDESDSFEEKKKRTKFITIRVTEEELALLDHIAEVERLTRSKLTRRATTQYALMHFRPINKKNANQNPKIMISQKIVKYLLNDCSDEKLNKIAEMIFQQGIEDNELDKFLIKNMGMKNEIPPEKMFEHHLHMITTYVLSDRGQNWYSPLNYTKHKNTIILYGKHKMGYPFSKMSKYLFEKYAEYGNYKLIKEELRADMINLQFEPKIKT